ncbi:splicing factor 3B subunit 1-like [Dorcoceras hygrometricum]|uniref:Splicing factor 3B subunit 1-like n=1 Tax=Dorcoceras hygrometricum TaxID=472368 RepID=A0A2Z7D2A9_9LAMI|nr:splicing factor 3B subunit 1-like [Dorcoceras hygrometricum]
MASSLINNTIHVYFDSVLGMEHEGMVAMFEDLMLSGLRGFWDVLQPFTKLFWWNSSTTLQSGTDDNLDGAENEISRKMASFTAPKQFLKEPLRSGEGDDMYGSKQPSKITKPAAAEKDKEIESVDTEDFSLEKSVAMMTDSEDTEPLSKVLELTDKSKSDEESMSIEDILKQIPDGMMMPSMTAAEITRIKFGHGIEILGVNEGDWYKASLPRIPTSDKGKAPLVAEDEIKGHPAREMILRTCSEAHRQNFKSGQPTTAIDLQIIALLSDAHLFSLETLQTQMRIHGLKWERICSSILFEGENRDRGAVIARSNTNNRSSCWIRTMILVDGSCIIQEGGDFWKTIPRKVSSSQWELLPQRQYDDTLALISEPFKIIRKRWADVCIEVVQFSAFNLLQPVVSHNFCRALVVRSSVRELEVDPTEFCGVFRRGPDVHLISSDSSSSSIHPDPTASDSFSQRNPETFLNSPSQSTSTDSLMLFTTDDIPLGIETAVDQILMPTADVTPQDFTEPLAQLRDSVNQIQIERVQKRDDVEERKDVLLIHIKGLEKRFTRILEQQDRTYRGLFANVRQEFQLQKAALSLEILESRRNLQSQQLSGQLISDLRVFIFDSESSVTDPDGEQLKTSCNKREMKFEFRLHNDILAKTITVKAGSFDAITHERFLMMAAIHGGAKSNWGSMLFNLLKDMVTPSSKQARGFAVQICIILKGAPDLELGDSKAFPPLKILTPKTVGTYIAKNKYINAEDVLEVRVEKMVKKAATNRRAAPAIVVRL